MVVAEIGDLDTGRSHHRKCGEVAVECELLVEPSAELRGGTFQIDDRQVIFEEDVCLPFQFIYVTIGIWIWKWQ